ncbi:MAG: hypothetical protein OXE52_09250 [Chloroflexi bacterium]|nr:hypothetical protein [Chloroflexota bacterium]
MSDAQDSSLGERPGRNHTPDIPLPPDLLDAIPEEKRAELIQFVSEVAIVSHFSGPLPPPDVLNQYDSETRKTIVAESVKQRRHRADTESRGQILFFVRDILSLLIAFALAFRLIDGSIYSIQQGQSIEGLLGIGGAVAVIAGAFLRDRKRRRDRIERDSLSPEPPEGESAPN